MKITVGIEAKKEQTESVIGTLAALRFPAADLDLVNVADHHGIADSILGASAFIANSVTPENLKALQAHDQNSLDLARELALRHEMPARTHRLSGSIGNHLLAFCRENQADLLALGSSHKGPIEGIVIGSVGRKAIISSTCSILIAKSPPAQGKKLKAVLATDHSPYADRCFEILAKFAPLGLAEIVVMSTYPSQLVSTMMAASPHFKWDANQIIQKELNAANLKLIQRLHGLGSVFSSVVREGPVNDLIFRSMRDENADLLILGAQGHGFTDRMMTGSVSLKQAMSEPKSVLVLRAPQDAA